MVAASASPMVAHAAIPNYELSSDVNTYVKKADWGGLRDYLNLPSSSYLSLLLKTPRSKSLVPPSSDPEGTWQDLKFACMELSDFALSKRSVYFNSADLKEVQKMIDEVGYSEDDNMKEGERLRKEAEKIAKELKRTLST
ncbi:hypothetical protein TrRE_jg10294 [Triparma retinervis]|uniref:Uncharacterized protein n=1 Tax=Triparma retinervis TaxID=2557542 RepID=A0A9W7FBX7_9STRA|nr:hypothetical protein TrRE_jg10294 [Triparma retinervis]